MKPEDYELLVGRLVQLLLDQDLVVKTSVKHLATYTGLSGQRYEVDLSYCFSIGGVNYLTIVECKHWSKRVPRSVVAALAATVSDIGAHKGVVVSSRGFQEGAVGLARANGIALLKVSDSEEPELHAVSHIEGPVNDLLEYLTRSSPLYAGGDLEEVEGIVQARTDIDEFITQRYGSDIVSLLSRVRAYAENKEDITTGDLIVLRSRLSQIPDGWYEDYYAREAANLPLWVEPSIPIRIRNIEIVAAKEFLKRKLLAAAEPHAAPDS